MVSEQKLTTGTPARHTRSHIKLEIASQDAKQTKPIVTEESEDDSEEESDDDAPEEETVSSGKQLFEQKKQAELASINEQKRILKEKRRQQDLKNKEQQLAKIQAQNTQEEEVPDLLPMDLLETYDASEQDQSTTILPKKIKFSDLENEQENAKRLRDDTIKSKLKQAKLLNSTVSKKGPVTVRVLKQQNSRMLSVPLSTLKGKKDKWLVRKSLKRG
ncbi:hypothetical protein CANARDRAFT_7871 [[Candida] arabinofermentans NRRL YB-2248]|uniref:Uncharacterized protein n=1 Tax=[Candida] arabinofermentans NRRL YB-2248 TaxID=983967 RepID=A0A1E4T0C9_9ASCO|nr:hypothetical protein CANARDRAFT_7871 [[Candida] arabinofermentans NRRL YB-2248]